MPVLICFMDRAYSTFTIYKSIAAVLGSKSCTCYHVRIYRLYGEIVLVLHILTQVTLSTGSIFDIGDKVSKCINTCVSIWS